MGPHEVFSRLASHPVANAESPERGLTVCPSNDNISRIDSLFASHFLTLQILTYIPRRNSRRSPCYVYWVLPPAARPSRKRRFPPGFKSTATSAAAIFGRNRLIADSGDLVRKSIDLALKREMHALPANATTSLSQGGRCLAMTWRASLMVFHGSASARAGRGTPSRLMCVEGYACARVDRPASATAEEER